MFFVAVILVASLVDARNIPSQDPKVLFFLRDDKLYQLKPPYVNEELLVHGVTSFDLDANAVPLWMDRTGSIYRSSHELVIPNGQKISTARFAFDHLTHKFYIVRLDSIDEHVEQAGVDKAVLFGESWIEGDVVIREEAKMLALNPRDGLMFVLADFNGVTNIYLSGMDGTEKRKLAEDVSSDELSIDHRRGRVYWVNTKQSVIENIDFDGVIRRAVGGLEGVGNKTTITVLDGEIFWSTDEGVVSACKLRENTCDKTTLRQLKLRPSLHPIKSLKLAAKDTEFKSACWKYNGGCQHMCLLNSRNGSSCVCYLGWQQNGKQCKPKRPKRQSSNSNMYTQSPTWRPEPQPQPDMSGLPIHIFAAV